MKTEPFPILKKLFTELDDVDVTAVIDTIHSDKNNSNDQISILRSNPDISYRLLCMKVEPSSQVYNIGRYGDLLMGFYAEEDDATFDLMTGCSRCQHKIQKGKFVHALRGTFIPMISTMYHEVRINPTVPVYLVYALLQDSERKTFVYNPIHYVVGNDRNPNPFAAEHYYIDRGYYLGPGPRENHYNSKQVIELPNLEKVDYMALSKERTAILLCELMAKTWHPSRFRSWCLPFDDEFFTI